jgi:hypothetical protein
VSLSPDADSPPPPSFGADQMRSTGQVLVLMRAGIVPPLPFAVHQRLDSFISGKCILILLHCTHCLSRYIYPLHFVDLGEL